MNSRAPERTGFTPSTLRFHEEAGLVHPDRIAELVAFTAELRQVAAVLGLHAPDGPCDDTCGCTAERDGASPGAVRLSAKPSGTGDPSIACTLSRDHSPERGAEWQMTLTTATRREPVEGGVRLRFSADTDVAPLASLAAAEQDCRQFFTLQLTVGPNGITLDVTGPPDARPVIDALIGATA